MTAAADHRLAMAVHAIAEQLSSPNVEDRNGEPANIVDALDRIGNALWALAKAMRRFNPHDTDEEYGSALLPRVPK